MFGQDQNLEVKMKLIIIIDYFDKVYAVNTNNICCVYHNGAYVIITTSCGQNIATKFTDVNHAVDFIQRAPSVSMGVS